MHVRLDDKQPNGSQIAKIFLTECFQPLNLVSLNSSVENIKRNEAFITDHDFSSTRKVS